MTELTNATVTTLQARAHQLSMAQHASLIDGYTWAEAFDELRDITDKDTPKTFVPDDRFAFTDYDSLYSHVDENADVILDVLKEVYGLAQAA